MITITLGGKLEDCVPVTVDIPRMDPMPDVLSYHHRIYVRRTDHNYHVARMWPILDELDKAVERKKRKLPETVDA